MTGFLSLEVRETSLTGLHTRIGKETTVLQDCGWSGNSWCPTDSSCTQGRCWMSTLWFKLVFTACSSDTHGEGTRDAEPTNWGGHGTQHSADQGKARMGRHGSVSSGATLPALQGLFSPWGNQPFTCFPSKINKTSWSTGKWSHQAWQADATLLEQSIFLCFLVQS